MNYCWTSIELVFKNLRRWYLHLLQGKTMMEFLLSPLNETILSSCKTNCNVMHTAVRYNVIHG